MYEDTLLSHDLVEGGSINCRHAFDCKNAETPVIQESSDEGDRMYRSMHFKDKKQKDKKRSREGQEPVNPSRAGNPPVCFIPISCMEGNMFSQINDLPGGFPEYMNSGKTQSDPLISGPYVPILYFAPLAHTDSKTSNKDKSHSKSSYKSSRNFHPKKCTEEYGDRRQNNESKAANYDVNLDWDNEQDEICAGFNQKSRFSSGCSSVLDTEFKRHMVANANQNLKASAYPRNDLKPVLTRESICMGSNVKKAKKPKKHQQSMRTKQEDQYGVLKLGVESSFKTAQQSYTDEPPRQRYNEVTKPKKDSDVKLKLPNYSFYTSPANQPDGIETTLRKLESNPKMFENISLIYKLFPNNQLLTESSETVPLTNKEKMLMTSNEVFQTRYMTAYRSLLNYYGMEFAGNGTDIQRGPNAIECYKQAMGNNIHHRTVIEIVIKSLCALGYDEYALSWIVFLMKEVMLYKKFLPTQKTVKAIQEIWIKSLNKEGHRSMAFDLFRRYFKEGKIEEKIMESRMQGHPLMTGGYRCGEMSY